MAFVIDLEEKMLGKEPTFTDGKVGSLTSCLTWYAYMKNYSDSKKYLIEYFKKNGDKKNQEFFSKVDENRIGNLGFIARMKTNGAIFETKVQRKFEYELEKIREENIVTQVKVKESKTGVNLQQRITDKSSEYAGEVLGIIDECFINRKWDFNFYQWLLKNQIKNIHTKKIVEVLNNQKRDLEEKDAHLYYSLNKKEISNFIKMLEIFISDCEKIKKPKVVRKKKAKPLESIVSKVSYKKEDHEYKIKSIDPKLIVDAEQLIIFNTTYKKIGVFFAESGKKLSIKGTTIINFDEEKSLQKVCRKPELVINKIMKARKNGTIKCLDDLTTKYSNLTGRINSDIILLKVF